MRRHPLDDAEYIFGLCHAKRAEGRPVTLLDRAELWTRSSFRRLVADDWHHVEWAISFPVVYPTLRVTKSYELNPSHCSTSSSPRAVFE